MTDRPKLPPHLGGHLNKTHDDRGVLEYFWERGARSLLDIGCGPGGQAIQAHSLGYAPVVGVDGDFTLEQERPSEPDLAWVTHDFTTGPLSIHEYGGIDLVWMNEFLEHIEEKYIPNVMATINNTAWAAVTCHPPDGKKNKWHFNEQGSGYWIDVFGEYGWYFAPEMTSHAKAKSTMGRDFFRKNGLVFHRSQI